MTRARRPAPRLRLATGALVGLAPVAPLVAGPGAARAAVAAYTVGCVVVLVCWLRWARRHEEVERTGQRRADELARQVERFSALLDAGRAVNSARELESVLQRILDKAVTIVRGSTGSVMLCDGDALSVVAVAGNDRALGRRLGLGDGIAGRVAMTRTPLLVNGTASATRFPGLVARASKVSSSMSVPMVDRDELIGVLNVGAPPSRIFDDEDIQTLAAFAEHAAAAISKARLYEASRTATLELAHRATHDALTGLPNRSVLRDRVAVAVAGGPDAAGALLFVDLDGFKLVNDGFGHSAGDRLLVITAERVRDACPEEGVAARIGGDEFAVFLPRTSTEDDAAAVAESLIESIRRPITFGRHDIAFSASIGIALVGAHGASYPELMESADRALYRAKRGGKNRWHVADPGDVEPRARVPRPRHDGESATWGDHVSS